MIPESEKILIQGTLDFGFGDSTYGNSYRNQKGGRQNDY